MSDDVGMESGHFNEIFGWSEDNETLFVRNLVCDGYYYLCNGFHMFSGAILGLRWTTPTSAKLI